MAETLRPPDRHPAGRLAVDCIVDTRTSFVTVVPVKSERTAIEVGDGSAGVSITFESLDDLHRFDDAVKNMLTQAVAYAEARTGQALATAKHLAAVRS